MRVEKADLEAKLREIQGAVEETTGGARGPVLLAVGVVILVALVFLLGKRRGRKGGARVEVFRLG